MVSVQLTLAPFFILGSGEPLDGVNLVAFAPGLLRGSTEPLVSVPQGVETGRMNQSCEQYPTPAISPVSSGP